MLFVLCEKCELKKSQTEHTVQILVSLSLWVVAIWIDLHPKPLPGIHVRCGVQGLTYGWFVDLAQLI